GRSARAGAGAGRRRPRRPHRARARGDSRPRAGAAVDRGTDGDARGARPGLPRHLRRNPHGAWPLAAGAAAPALLALARNLLVMRGLVGLSLSVLAHLAVIAGAVFFLRAPTNAPRVSFDVEGTTAAVRTAERTDEGSPTP